MNNPHKMTYKQFLKMLRPLYKKRINKRLFAQIGQLVAKDWWSEGNDMRSQFLVLVLYDEVNENWMCLKLSTARKVWKFVVKKGFEKARRLGVFELAKLKKLDKK